MSEYKVCVYAISKNEEQFVDRWMDAVSEADEVIVTDTGSSDRTVEKLKARGAIVYEETISPWRFDTARNVAMDHIPADTDICVSNDLDEVFAPGWRQKLENSWTDKHTRARYWFVWSFQEDGSPDKRFSMEKIHARHGFRWVHPVHEVLEYSGAIPDRSVFIDDLLLYHYPDNNKPRSQYLPLLELSVQENPDDDRGMFWLGREYVFYHQPDKAIETLQRHLAMPTARWDEERSASMRFLAQAFLQKQNNAEARSWLLRAIAECPHVREPWLELAKLGYLEADWTTTYFAAVKGLEIQRRTESYLTDPASWGYSLYDMAALACYHLGMYKSAADYGNMALLHDPDNARLKKNLLYYKEKL